MESKQRKAIRDRREQLLTLVNGWDPAGLLAAGAPRDEYDALVDRLLGLLMRGATRDEVTSYLEAEVLKIFGTAPNDTDEFVNRAFAWFNLPEE